MEVKKRVFSTRELSAVKYGSLTYYIAHELKKVGAPIEFNVMDINVNPEDIKIIGELRDRIKMDGSHEFIFRPLLETEG